jgi:hypothetical protein
MSALALVVSLMYPFFQMSALQFMQALTACICIPTPVVAHTELAARARAGAH